MPGLLPDIDPDGLLEYSVVFTDRSLNHMSRTFQGVMNDISATLKKVYRSERVVIVPGGGTYGMESVARQFATGRKCLVVRNGFFSYRWSQILDMGGIDSETIVMKARREGHEPQAPFAPVPIDELVARIETEKPEVVFAPHVETSSGMLLPDGFVRAVADAVHSVGGLFVLDCIASGELWVDMQSSGVDVLISAPQKGWSASPCSALVMLGPSAAERIGNTSSTSFACDLRKWLEIMAAVHAAGIVTNATMLYGHIETVDERLEHLMRLNLFVIPLDDEHRWYRYHQLFADLLQNRLRQTLFSFIFSATDKRNKRHIMPIITKVIGHFT